MGATNLAEHNVSLEQREIRLHTLNPGIRTPLLTALAWAIVVATSSGDTETTIEYFDPLISGEAIHITAQLDATASVRNIHDQLLGKLDEQRRSLQHINGASEKHDQEKFGIVSRRPRTLIAVDMSTAVQSFANNGNYDLVLALTNTSDESCFKLVAYSTKIVDGHDTNTILGRVENLIPQLVSNKAVTLRDLDLLSASDRAKLAAWNESMPPASDICVHDLIEHQAKIRPHSEAVCAWDGSFTYEELNQRANALASRLVEAGAGYGSFVPVMFEKSKWQPVSILAVLRSGAAFVALEHTIPNGRISMMLKQFETLPAFLASKYQEARFAALVNNIIVVDEDSTREHVTGISLPGRGDVPKVQPNSPAYAIFTSGTTGTPKGAVIEHRQLSTSMQALNDKIGATSDMRKFQMTAYNFDLSISETFCPLLCGGCVTIPSEWARFNDLAHAFESLDSNFGSFSPSFLATLSEKEFPKMKGILLAGERISADLSNFWTRHGRRVVHMYGPTECTVGCTFLDADVQAHYDGFIGDAYASKIWVIDPEDSEKLMPIGAPGELLVEGPIVGSHYLGDPEKTRNSFIEPPAWFSTICHRNPSRFYRTGDLGRLTQEGSFEIIGRKDTQIKIRGLRVETEEVENQILAAAGTKIGVAVQVRNPDRTPGQEILVAFLQLKSRPETQPEPSLEILYDDLGSRDSSFSKLVAQIKPKLQDVLPAYMIPSICIPVTALPFSNSYKLNRRALKELANGLSMSDLQDAISGKVRKYSDQDLTPDERMLRNIWATALQTTIGSIDIQDDFFSIGGDSLKAMALISEARRKGIHFTVANLYDARTIKDLSRMIGREGYDESPIPPFSLIAKSQVASMQMSAAESCDVAVENIQDILPLNDMQDFFLRPTLQDPRSWVTPVVFDLPRGLDPSKFQRAWEQLMARHPITRTRFIHTSSGFFQVILKRETVVWRFGTNEDELLKALGEIDMSFGNPSHSHGLLKTHDQMPTRLIWLVNHSLSDRIMDDHIAQELSLLYQGQAHSLPRRPPFQNTIQHVLQRDRTASKAFWKSHMSGANFKPIFESVTANPEPFANIQLLLRAKVDSAARQTKHRENSVVMTALAVAVGRVAAVEDVPFYLLHAGRDPTFSGSEDVMGPLLTRAPIRICVKPGRNLTTILSNVDDDLGKCLQHDIVDEQEFRDVSPETAAHASNAILINIQPPFSGFLLDSNALFFPGYDPRHGMGYRTYAFAMNVTFEGTTAVVKVMWKERSIHRETIQRLLDILEEVFRSLEKIGYTSGKD